MTITLSKVAVETPKWPNSPIGQLKWARRELSLSQLFSGHFVINRVITMLDDVSEWHLTSLVNSVPNKLPIYVRQNFIRRHQRILKWLSQIYQMTLTLFVSKKFSTNKHGLF